MKNVKYVVLLGALTLIFGRVDPRKDGLFICAPNNRRAELSRFDHARQGMLPRTIVGLAMSSKLLRMKPPEICSTLLKGGENAGALKRMHRSGEMCPGRNQNCA